MTRVELKTYILTHIDSSTPVAKKPVEDFLEGLASTPDELAHHLLLCLAIDLKCGSLTANQLIPILSQVDMSKPVFEAFQNAIDVHSQTNGLLFSNYTCLSHKKANCDYYATVIKKESLDRYYLNRAAGIPGSGKFSNGTGRPPQTLRDCYEDKTNQPYTILKKWKIAQVFWLTPYAWVLGLIDEAVSRATTNPDPNAPSNLVDLLGLDHFKKNDEKLVYMKISADLVPIAYQPTTFQAAWNDIRPEDALPYTPFLSFHGQDGWGRTFSLQGMKTNQDRGQERVIDKIHVDTDEKRDKISFHIIPGKVKGLSGLNNQNALIQAGITRFN
ncbi:MAG: hypothetical protein EAZ91_18425 [Cytophagales bacterium]|nr:MAG: hypothetical protein EAZ91_18425 [Cytophagales bacterium]